MSEKPIRVRFAPSPTGDFHVGGARTALFNYLFARHSGGKFILRIEDTDRNRYNPDALDYLINGLNYLKIDWDEGPEKGGDFGPYYQSERLELYHKHIETLLKNGSAYRCFCTPERLKEVVEQQKREKSSFIGYDRHCRNLPESEVQEKLKQNKPYVVRFKMPLDGETEVEDAIRGKIRFSNRGLQDAVLIKSDGYPTYHFANVVDDHLMEISHILRGDEWVNSLPLHINLYKAFGWEPPIMAHLPVILNPSGKGKMSKRESRAPDGSVRPVFVRQFEELGYLSEALVNFMALVGWSFDDSRERFSREELIQNFSLQHVHKAPAVWNYDKLNQFNAQSIREMDEGQLAERILPYLKQAGIETDATTLLNIIPLISERLVLLADVPKWVDFFFMEPEFSDVQLFVPKKETPERALEALNTIREELENSDFEHQSLFEKLKSIAIEKGWKAGPFFQPLRVAVCGKKVAPPLFESMEIIGKEKVLKRVDAAKEFLKANLEK